MENNELLALNAEANEQIETAVESLKEKIAGGDMGSLVSLFMSPAKAVEKFGDDLSGILDGLEKMRSVNTELVQRVAGGEQ